MPHEARTIPFTAAQRSTIRVTALLMLPVGVIMSITASLKLIELLPQARMLALFPLIVGLQWLGALIELAFGIGLLIAALALISVARTGTVDALVRGLRALCVVYMIKAALLLLAAAAVIFAFLGLPLIL